MTVYILYKSTNILIYKFCKWEKENVAQEDYEYIKLDVKFTRITDITSGSQLYKALTTLFRYCYLQIDFIPVYNRNSGKF